MITTHARPRRTDRRTSWQ